MKPHRILFITQEYSEHDAGGAGVFAQEITAALAMVGAEVHVLAPGTANRRVHVRDGLVVHHLKVIRKPLLLVPSFHWQVWRQAKRIVAREHIDTIHCNDSAGLMALRLRPTVATLHHPVRYELRLSTGLQTLINLPDVVFETIVLRRAQRITVPSHLVYELVGKMSQRAQAKTEVVSNGVGKGFLRAVSGKRIRGELGVGADEVLLFFPGGARAKRKGGLDLIAALQKLDGNPHYRCMISGASREAGWAKEFQAALERSGLSSRMLFVGEIGYDELPAHYAAADLVAYPSTFEGFGLPVIEAMASGRAVIATATGEAPYIIDKSKNGELIQVGDVAGLHRALKKLLASKTLRERYGQAGQKRVAHNFSWPVLAKRMLAIHNAAVKEDTA